jgi:hypothetical protein
VLALTDGMHSAEQIAEELAQKYQIPLDVAQNDIRELYDQLFEQ